MHRHLKPYHVRGEWFDIKCMELVNSWRIRNIETREEEEGIEANEKLDEEFNRIFS